MPIAGWSACGELSSARPAHGPVQWLLWKGRKKGGKASRGRSGCFGVSISCSTTQQARGAQGAQEQGMEGKGGQP